MAENDGAGPVRAAAIIRPPAGGSVDCLEGFIRILQGQGYVVRGLIQRNDPAASSDCACAMKLVDVGNRQEFKISQDLGQHSEGCRVDTSQLAEASVVLRQALSDKADLVVINKFGKLEAEGRGLADELLTVMASGTPMVTTVEFTLLDRWRDFSGGLAHELAPTCGGLMRWWDDVKPKGLPRGLRRSEDQGAFQRMEPIPETS